MWPALFRKTEKDQKMPGKPKKQEKQVVSRTFLIIWELISENSWLKSEIRAGLQSAHSGFGKIIVLEVNWLQLSPEAVLKLRKYLFSRKALRFEKKTIYQATWEFQKRAWPNLNDSATKRQKMAPRHHAFSFHYGRQKD